MTVPVAAARAVGTRAGARAAGGRAAARRAPAADPRVSAPGSAAARQREEIEQLKARRVEPDVDAESTSPPPASPGGGLSVPMPAAASTGSGFLLGVFAWALGLAYLEDGSAGVRRFLAAKFFNKTS